MDTYSAPWIPAVIATLGPGCAPWTRASGIVNARAAAQVQRHEVRSPGCRAVR